MKTTLIIPDPVFRELKNKAVERGETISGLVTEYLVRGLRERPARKHLRPLPSFNMGKAKVDIADREALHDVLDADRDARLYGRKR